MTPAPSPPTPSPLPVPRALHRLARAWGVQTAFYDCHGVRHHASVDTLLAVLAALGAPVSRLADVDDALAARTASRWGRAAEPVLVAWDGLPPPLDLRLPESAADGRLAGELRLESGETRALSWDLATAARMQSADVDGLRRLVLRVTLDGAGLPLPFGYHALHLSLGGRALTGSGRDGATTVISAPQRVDGHRTPPPRPRDWGVFLPLYALRSERSLGLGDLTDLGALSAWIGERGGQAVSTLPLLAAFLDGEHGDGGLFEPSPYVPASRLAWNDLYLDLSAEPEWRHPDVTSRVGAGAFAAERDRLQRADHHDYARLAALRRPLLSAMAEAAFASPRRGEIEAWARGHPAPAEYARFRGACAGLGGWWGGWPAPAAAGTLTDADVDPAVARRHLYAQFAAARQVAARAAEARARGVRLLFDQPLGVHPDGYDVWRHRELFAGGISTGAPPDAFFVKGQDWGFRPLLPEANRADGYRYVAATLRHLLVPGQMLRMDHVLGLHRLYWVPHGAPATAGAYVRGHHEESFAVLTLEAHRADARVIGEDIGTVPRGLRAQMTHHGLLRTHVMQFAPHARVPASAVASLNTQDLPPFAGFLEGTDIDGFADLGLIDPGRRRHLREERAALVADLRTWLEDRGQLRPDHDGHALMRACNGHLAESRAALVLVNLEDLWDEPRPHNVPGTHHERPNWKRAAARTLEQITSDPEVTDALDEVAERRRRPSRPPTRPMGDARRTQIGPLDLDLFARGLHTHAADVLGGRREVAEDISGVRFTAWAPGAAAVSVFGEFDGWDPARHPLTPAVAGGLWEAFVPGASRGALYKFRVTDRDGVHDHADPFAARGEAGGRGASMVWSRQYDWGDDGWLSRRAERLAALPADGQAALDGGGRPLLDDDGRPLPLHRAALLSVSAPPAEGWTAQLPALAEVTAGYEQLGVRFSAEAWGPHPGAPGPAGSVPQELMALVDGLHRRGLAAVFEWRPDPRAFDLSADAADDDPWARRERLSQLLGSALLRVSAFHADALELPADAGIPAAFVTRLADLLSVRHPGVRLLRSPA